MFNLLIAIGLLSLCIASFMQILLNYWNRAAIDNLRETVNLLAREQAGDDQVVDRQSD
jgi:hypothetical protein